ncbi:DUF3108 domain-containing protein [Shewanella inventionis]|uniref:DUF3108 domain-containing protein n=1 Tax=Shewanella inventionis TaxID=1738770 RepID=UPI001CBE0014|nr:DUF3108 domain-containing protein [Shewanella inventionis]
MINIFFRSLTLMCFMSPVAFVHGADNALSTATDGESTKQLNASEVNAIAETIIQHQPQRLTNIDEQAAILSPLIAHTANYTVFYGDIELGVARYRLPATNSGFYRYEFNSDVSLLMLSDQRSLKSEFTLENGKLVPFRYVHERSGTGSDYAEQTAFAKAQQFIHTIYKKEALKLPYEDNIFDPLAVQLQFRMDLAANIRPLDYKMVKEKEVDDYQFRVLGKETLVLKSGTYDTVKVEVVREAKKAKKRQTYFWMATNLAYLPVRLSHFSKGSKQLDIQLADYHFEKPLPPMTPIMIDGPLSTDTTALDDLVTDAENNTDISDSELDEIKRLATD